MVPGNVKNKKLYIGEKSYTSAKQGDDLANDSEKTIVM